MKTTLLTAAFSVLSLAAFAGTSAPAKGPAGPVQTPVEPFSYNFVEAGYVHVFPDDLDDLDGYYAHLSFSPVQNVFLFTEWSQAFGDASFGDYDVSSLELGAGFYLPLCNRVDFVVTAAAVRYEVDTDFGGDDEWGFDASAGLRIRLCSQLEAGVFYGYTNVDDEDFHSGSVGLVYSLTDNVDLTVRGTFSEDEQEVGVGVRYNF